MHWHEGLSWAIRICHPCLGCRRRFSGPIARSDPCRRCRFHRRLKHWTPTKRCNSGTAQRHTRRVYGHRHAGLNGRSQTRACHPQTLAANQTYRDVGV